VDLQVLGPYIGFFNTRSGIVDVNTSVTGRGPQFNAMGNLASNAIHYQDPVVDAQTAGFSARFKADAKQLLVSDVRTKLPEGGEVDGEFQFDNWLDTRPRSCAHTRAGPCLRERCGPV
jgi:hypothetical protein